MMNIDYRDYRTLTEFVKALTDAAKQKKQSKEQEAIKALKREYNHLFRMMDNDSQISYRLRPVDDAADYILNVVRQKFLGYVHDGEVAEREYDNIYANLFVNVHSSEGCLVARMYPDAGNRPKHLNTELDNLDFLIQELYPNKIKDDES